MATKRTHSDATGSSESSSDHPPVKKAAKYLDEFKIGPVSTMEEMDMKVLAFQNKKLCERLEQRRKAEAELRQRIEQLEKRQATDDAVLCIVNRYWNQLDEDIRILLHRFDAETVGDDTNGTTILNVTQATTSFLAQLSSWDKQEIEDKLHQRVEFSKRSVGKLIQAYDRLLQRNEKLRRVVLGDDNKKQDEASGGDEDKEGEHENEKNGEANDNVAEGEEKEDHEKEVSDETPEEMKDNENELHLQLPDLMKVELRELQQENTRLNDLVTDLHKSHHEASLKYKDLQDKLAAAETEIAELKNKMEDDDFELQVSKERCEKLSLAYTEVQNKLLAQRESTTVYQIDGSSSSTLEGVSKYKFNQLVGELEETREQTASRLNELEKLQKEHQESVKEVERLQLELQQLPEKVIVDTTEYKCLQSKFSVLYNESMQMKQQLEETRTTLQNSKNAHLRQIEQMEGDELACQKKLRTEVIQLEDNLAQVRKEYEMLRIEFEQTLAANEQTGPINREMRHLITSLQNHNHQLKGEVNRYKRKLREAQTDIAKFKAELNLHDGVKHEVKSELDEPVAVKTEDVPEIKKEPVEVHVKLEPEDDYNRCEEKKDIEHEIKKRERHGSEKHREEKKHREREMKADPEIIKDLKAQLKKSQDSQKEMKLLLDMYKSAPKEQRDKVMLMANEKKARQEIDDLKAHIRKLQENERKEKRKLADDDAIRKIKKHEETIDELQKNLKAQKQEEDAMLNEMEVTGQAFEDMQEQNVRLLQQLREKDDANFKLMSERIKFNQIHKLLREEKEVLGEQVGTLQAQVEAQMQVVRQLEEKERILQNNLSTVEKELSLRQQALEMHKRKSIEGGQTVNDLQMHLDKYTAQLKDAQMGVAEKAAALEKEMFKQKRMQEEIASLKKKLDRMKKIELAGTADEVLLEEIKEYKEQLTCPSCKVKKKDAILTKCFHVFCLECLRTRYETRQRKCPKCNAGFGANDFHRVYLS
ncbi:E3 ubiquitin-protein ligase Bre1-like [Tubulanus polymorphus]|uniref:E3 ubiquitin-protein ligase Bre1-like n=1 Tax=Tubulanus polymorphus TaxID=672921 RepID=UPI003DA5A4D7